MGYQFYVTILLVPLLFFLAPINHADTDKHRVFIKARCAEWRPFVYEEKGQLVGPAYEIALQVLKHSQHPFDYQLQPWARVYNDALNQPNFLVACIGRTPKREKLFHWIGPISKGVDIHFFKLSQNSLKISGLSQAKDYKVGAMRGTYNYDFLSVNGFEDENIHQSNTSKQLLNMLINKRYELVISDEKQLKSEAKKLNVNPDLFEKALFAFTVTDNIAFSLNTSGEVIKTFRDSYLELEYKGRFKGLLH